LWGSLEKSQIPHRECGAVARVPVPITHILKAERKNGIRCGETGTHGENVELGLQLVLIGEIELLREKEQNPRRSKTKTSNTNSHRSQLRVN